MKSANIQKARSDLVFPKINNPQISPQGKLVKSLPSASDWAGATGQLPISSYKVLPTESYVTIKTKHIYIFLFGISFFALGLMASESFKG